MGTGLGVNGTPITVLTSAVFSGSFICIGGVWKSIAEIYICIDGVWKTLDTAYICISSSWKTVD